MFKFQVLLSVIVAFLLNMPTQASTGAQQEPRSLRGTRTLSKNTVAGEASSGRTLSKKTAIDPVDLGTAGNFAILSKSGVSTTPGSDVCGNVGTSPIAATALTGFSLTPTTAGDAEFSSSAMVTGNLYGASHAAPTPAMLSASVSAMEAAYTDAAGRADPNKALELFAGSFPATAVLEPGVYKWSSVVTVPVGGTVTFNGSSTDQWIMQIAGNLAIGTNANILLTNGAKAENIFWAVAGDIAVGVDAHAEGIFLTYTMIAMKTGSSLNGALYAQTAVTLDAATINACGNNAAIEAPQTINEDQGDLTGWNQDITGSAIYETESFYETKRRRQKRGDLYTPQSGNSFVVIPSGCQTNRISKSFTGNEGGTISGWAAFDADDYVPYNDVAVVKVLQGNEILFYEDVSSVGNWGSTPWTAFSFTFPSGGGTFTLEASCTNTKDCKLTSFLLLDGVQYSDKKS
jgi:hypothetical protein